MDSMLFVRHVMPARDRVPRAEPKYKTTVLDSFLNILQDHFQRQNTVTIITYRSLPSAGSRSYYPCDRISKYWISKFWASLELRLNQGCNFESKVSAEVAQLLELRKACITLLNPWSDGMLEMVQPYDRPAFIQSHQHCAIINWDYFHWFCRKSTKRHLQKLLIGREFWLLYDLEIAVGTPLQLSQEAK